MSSILAMKILRVVFFAINLFPLCVYANNSTEKQLLSDIFQNYDERTRPLLNSSEHVKVKIEFSLLTVHDLDMRNQQLSSSADVSISWTDEFLKWNRSSYGGLGLIRVPLSEVWKPDVILSNSVNRKDIFEETGENVIIYNDGTVLWHSNKHLKTFENIDTTFYPFEEQVFDFNFSKLYFDDTYQQNYYSSEDNAIDNFVSNGEWDFNPQKGQTKKPYTEAHNRNGKIFSNIIWQFEMYRRQTYYVWSFLIPAAALSFVSVLTFLLSVKSSEKLTLAVFSFIAIAVVIRLFNQSLPSTSKHKCKFGVLMSINLGIVGFVIIVNVLISCCYHRKCYKLCGDDKPVSSDKVPITKDNPDSKKESATNDPTEIPPDETECKEARSTENPISFEKSVLEYIKSIKETVEKEDNRQKEEKKSKGKRMKRATKCDIFFGIIIFLGFIVAHLCVLEKFIFGTQFWDSVL